MCGPRASEHAARVEDADRLAPSHTFALAHPLDEISRLAAAEEVAGCRRRDAVAKRGSGRSGHGRPAEPRRQGCGGRGRPRWWRGAGSFAVTPTSDDRYGWSGIESWRNDALTGLTATLTGLLTAVLTDELAARRGRVYTLRQLTATLTGLLTATLTGPGHSPVSRGARSESRLMIGLSAEAEDWERVRTSDPPALRLRQATARARGVGGGRSPTHPGTSLRVRRGPNRTSSTRRSVNDIKRRGSSCCSDYAPPTRSDRRCRNARTSAPGVVAGTVGTPVLKVCAARTPLVVTPMQAVSAGPRRASRSILTLTP